MVSSFQRDLIRHRLRKKYGDCCFYCGKDCAKLRVLTLDHIQPASLGGQNIESNLLIACKDCNNLRGIKPMLEFFRNRINAFQRFCIGTMSAGEAIQQRIAPTQCKETKVWQCRWCLKKYEDQDTAANCTKDHLEPFADFMATQSPWTLLKHGGPKPEKKPKKQVPEKKAKTTRTMSVSCVMREMNEASLLRMKLRREYDRKETRGGSCQF